MADNTNTRLAAARAFVRSLNILLKFARMYDFGHPRTSKQYETAWTELRTALGSDDEAGLLLAVSGDQLLLDGTPLDAAAAEKGFARMLSAAGIASIHFAPKVTQASLARFVKGFPTGTSTKPAQLAEQLKAALEGDPHIHVNEVCFVPADSAVAKTNVAAQIAARTLGMSAEQRDELFNDPEKLLQLIMAAEGTKGGPGGSGAGAGGAGGGGSGTGLGSGGSGSGAGPGAGPGSGFGGGMYAGGGVQADSSGTASSGAPSGFYAGSASGTAEGRESGGSATGGVGVATGPFNPVRGAGAAGEGSGGSGPWNIVGGSGGGVPIDPNAGGFWLTKDAPSDSRAEGMGGLATPGSSGESGVSSPVSSAGGHGGGAPGHGVAGGPGAGGWSGLMGGTAEGGSVSRWAYASSGMRGSRSARTGGAGSMAVETGLMTLQQDELQGILQMLAQVARTSDAKEKMDPGAFQSRLSALPRRARFTVSQALSALAAQAPSGSADKPMLLKLAEHVAVRFAIESYERGEVKVSAVTQMLEEMSQELDGLRKILGAYEERMTQAGLRVESHMEVLAKDFWSQVSDEKRKSVLESGDAWCVPPSKVREHIEGLIAREEKASAEQVLQNYAACIKSKEREPRRQTALGLAELADLYANCDEKFFVETIREIGVRLADERDSELQSLLSAAFVRLSQQAMKKRLYPAIQRSVELTDYIESERPGSAKSLRPRIAVESRLPEFIDDALKAGEVPPGLSDLLRRMTQHAAVHIAGRFSRSGFRQDCDLLISMMEVLGPEGLEHLRAQLLRGNPGEAIDTLGILARMDVEALEQVLPGRMREWKRAAQDRAVRQLAGSGAPDRGRLLADLFDLLDPLVRPLAIDEIGMSGEKAAEMRLLRVAEGDLPHGGTDYLRLKAMEALGRLRTVASEAILRKIAEARKAWRWAFPSELRLVAAQAMEKIDAEWVRHFIPKSGLNLAEYAIDILDADPNSPAIRQRRYPRMRLEQPAHAVTLNLKENCQMEIPEMALGGGVAICEHSLHPGSVVEMRMQAGQKTVKAETIVRDANTQARAFEVVDMDLEERAKLRKLLVQYGSTMKASTPEERNRRGPRTILSATS